MFSIIIMNVHKILQVYLICAECSFYFLFFFFLQVGLQNRLLKTRLMFQLVS